MKTNKNEITFGFELLDEITIFDKCMKVFDAWFSYCDNHEPKQQNVLISFSVLIPERVDTFSYFLLL